MFAFDLPRVFSLLSEVHVTKPECSSVIYSSLLFSEEPKPVVVSQLNVGSKDSAFADFLLLLRITIAVISVLMRGIASLTPVKYKFRQIYPVAGSWGTLSTSTPKKQGSNESSEGDRIPNEKAEPIVAFSRPPPVPPVLGPLVAVSLLEMWSNDDS